MAVPSPSTEKADIRKDARKARTDFVCRLETDVRHALEEKLAELLAPLIAGASIIGAYAQIGSEISPGPLLKRAERLGKTIAYPTFSHGDEIFTFRAGKPLLPGPFQIHQPSEEDPEVVPDLVLVPLIACLDGGMRIGQGKGHYDRALAALEKNGARLIGLGWKIQRLNRAIEADEWDVPVHMFASPRGIEEFA